MYRNHVGLQGNLGDDADKHVFDDATKFRFRLATSRKWKDRATGEPREILEWHDIDWRVTNPGLIAYFERELVKGAGVDVEGSLHYRKFTDAKGVERTVAEIRAERVQVFPSAAQFAARAAREAATPAAPPASPPAAPASLEPDEVVFQ